MAWDSVPWFVGGGAHHSPEIARMLAYATVAGGEGVIAPTDCKVTAKDVPGGGVRVTPGAVAIRSRSAGGSQQAYVGRLPVAEEVPITATGTAGGRSDLIVAQIEDPFVAGEPWDTPTDPTSAQYIYTRVIENVPAGTTSVDALGLNRTAVALARVDLPASTGTVQAAHITDLRQMALSRTHRELRMTVPPHEAPLTSTDYVTWPDFAPTVEFPSWATSCSILATLSMVGHRDGQTWGDARVCIGSGSTPVRTSDTAVYDFALTPNGGTRHVVMVAGGWHDVADLAGSTHKVWLEGKRWDTRPGHLVTVAGTQLVFDISFSETAV